MFGTKDLAKKEATEFLHDHTRAVIATVDEKGSPYTSVIFYKVQKDGRIRFLTKDMTAKFVNIKNNPKISMTILEPQQSKALSLEGDATIIDDTKLSDESAQEILKLAYSELNDMAPIAKIMQGTFVVIEIEPTRFRYVDFTGAIGSGQFIKEVEL